MNESIRAGGVVLRTPAVGDVDDIVTACNDPETQLFLDMLPSPYTRRDALAWVEGQGPADRSATRFAIADPATDRIIGAVGLHGDAAVTGIGYWVAPWARRRGVATTATRALTAWAFARGFVRIELITDTVNTPSMRTALGAGFTHEGVRRAAGATRDGARRDLVVWVRLAGDRGEPVRRSLPDLPGAIGGTADPGPARSLTDGVITLTPVRADDAEDIYALVTLPEVHASSVAAELPARELIAERCATSAYQWLIGTRAEFVIRDAPTGAFAGEIGLFHEQRTGQAVIGYSVGRAWRGRRFAERAVRLLAGWAFAEAGIARLVAGTAPDNRASARTLERAGFVREGYERARLPGPGGTRVDNVAYALLPGDVR